MNETKRLKKGAFQIARKLFESEIWLNKPSTWKIIWIYILGNVNHETTEKYERGEGFFNFSREISLIGIDITSDIIKKALQFARKNEMIRTTRSTRGMRLKVLNYDKYQTLSNYRSTTVSTPKAREKHETSTPIYKNDNNEKNDKNIYNTPNSLEELILPLKAKYPESVIKDFIHYWTEKNPQGKKERWQMQKVFDPKRRLATWVRNNAAWRKDVPRGIPVEERRKL